MRPAALVGQIVDAIAQPLEEGHLGNGGEHHPGDQQHERDRERDLDPAQHPTGVLRDHRLDLAGRGASAGAEHIGSAVDLGPCRLTHLGDQLRVLATTGPGRLAAPCARDVAQHCRPVRRATRVSTSAIPTARRRCPVEPGTGRSNRCLPTTGGARRPRDRGTSLAAGPRTPSSALLRKLDPLLRQRHRQAVLRADLVQVVVGSGGLG